MILCIFGNLSFSDRSVGVCDFRGFGFGSWCLGWCRASLVEAVVWGLNYLAGFLEFGWFCGFDCVFSCSTRFVGFGILRLWFGCFVILLFPAWCLVCGVATRQNFAGIWLLGICLVTELFRVWMILVF